MVKVTQQILDRSLDCGLISNNKKYTESCMIALAVREILPDAKVVYITRDNVDKGAVIKCPVYNNPSTLQRISIRLPREAFLKMREFDITEVCCIDGHIINGIQEARRRIKPFEFEIFIPHVLIDMIGISQVYKILSESSTLELVKP